MNPLRNIVGSSKSAKDCSLAGATWDDRRQSFRSIDSDGITKLFAPGESRVTVVDCDGGISISKFGSPALASANFLA
jgi:hypothetical protein